MYALVINNEILVEQYRLPESAKLLSDPGTWITDLIHKSEAVQQSTGWYFVENTLRPEDTATHTHDREVIWTGTKVVESWVQRPKTVEELEATRLSDNQAAIDAAIVAAITQLDALISAPAVPTVPSGTMSTAQLSSNMRIVRDYIQENRSGAQQVADILKKTIKLVRGDYDSVN